MASFDEFWHIYPKKVARHDARRAWDKLAHPDQRDALAALSYHVASWSDRDKQFIPHAATWLRGRRWEDEIETRSQQMSDHEFFRVHGWNRRRMESA